MRFEQAVKAMKKGKKLTRAKWDGQLKYAYETAISCIKVQTENDDVIDLTIEDIEATDWKIFKKNKTLSDKGYFTGEGIHELTHHPNGLLFYKNDIKAALTEFIDWLHISKRTYKEINDKAKEIFGDDLVK
jgi:hypothetical protein